MKVNLAVIFVYSFMISVTLFADTIKPIAQILSPAQNASYVFGAPILVSSQVSDNVGIKNVQLRVDGLWNQTSTVSPYSFTINNPLSVGTHTIRLRAEDLAGNVGRSAIITINIVAPPDTTPPVTSILSPNNGALFLQGSTVVIDAQASDNVGVTKVELLRNGSIEGIDVTSPYSFSLSSLAVGQHQFQVKAYDAAFNQTLSAPISITVNAMTGSLPAFNPITLSNEHGSAATVHVSAHVQDSPPQIRLNWHNITNSTRQSISIQRKLLGDTSWGPVINVTPASANSWVDSNVQPGIAYEYKVSMTTSYRPGVGYVAAGIRVPESHYLGKILLVIESNLATSLAPEIQQYESDLVGAGWLPIRLIVNKSDSITSVRNAMLQAYNADPSQVKAALLIGSVPTPLFNNINPDGHGTTTGPGDTFYADLNGNWSVSTVNGNPNYVSNTSIPSTVELQVGRVIAEKMGASYNSSGSLVSPGVPGNEVTQIRGYFNRLHDFKIKNWIPADRALMIDGFTSMTASFSENGYRAISTLVGSDKMNKQASIPSSSNSNNRPVGGYHSALDDFDYRVSYTCGGGWTDAMLGVGGTDQISVAGSSGKIPRSLISIVFGSDFWRYDQTFRPTSTTRPQSYLTAQILSNSLASMWSGTLNWYLHQMAIGSHIGLSAKRVMDNKISQMYLPERGSYGWTGDNSNVYANLMGDPTLTLFSVSTASNFVISNNGGKFQFSWNPSNDSNIVGYNIYQISSNNISRVNSSIIGVNSFSSNLNYVSGAKFMVRAVKLQDSASGSYYNQSLGVQAIAP